MKNPDSCNITLSYSMLSGFNDPNLIDKINGAVRSKLISRIMTTPDTQTEMVHLTLEFATSSIRDQWLMHQSADIKRLIHE